MEIQMARRASNSKSGLDRISVLNGDSAGNYIRITENSIASLSFKQGVYSRSVNDNGWACPSGLDDVKTQGLIKSAAWAIRAIKKRASLGDAEAQIIVQNLEAIIRNASE